MKSKGHFVLACALAAGLGLAAGAAVVERVEEDLRGWDLPAVVIPDVREVPPGGVQARTGMVFGDVSREGQYVTAGGTGDGGLWATDVTGTSFLLHWEPLEAPDGYALSVSTHAAAPDDGITGTAFASAHSFTTGEGWGNATWTVGNTAVLSTNINEQIWQLYNLEVRPTIAGGTPAETGYIYLSVVNSSIVSPPIAGTVTQVVTSIRAAGTDVTGRKVTLAYSVDGGTNFTDLATYDASSASSVLPKTHVFSEGLHGGENGVMFRLRNASTGTGPTVLLHAWEFAGIRPEGMPGHAQEQTGLTSGQTVYARVRAAGAGDWSEPLAVQTGIQPGTLSTGVVTSNSIAVGWPALGGVTGYRVDVTPAAFSNTTVYAPTTTLGLAPNSGNGWYYEGEKVTGTVGSIRTALVYANYDATNFGHFLVGTNHQALVSDAIPIRGATAATLAFTSGAWNGGGDAETTRVNAYYKTDDGPWNFLGTQVSTSTTDGGSVAFAANLPRGALDGTNVFVKIVAPNARTASGYLRGAYVNQARVAFSSSGGDYGVSARVAGYPRTISSSSAILQDLQPETFYHFRVQALSGDFVRSRWTAGSATTAAVETGGEDPSEGIPQTVSSQPQGALSGVVVYTSGGHGFGANEAATAWITERGLLHAVNEDAGNLDQLNYFALSAWKAGATVVPCRPVGYQTNEVVLDNVDTAMTTRGQVTFTGNWADTSQTTLFYGSVGQVGYRFAYISTTGTTATAVYRPQIPEAGEYPVYTWVCHGSDRVPQLYRIHHQGGIMEVRVNHRQVGCGWVWLGNYYFSAGTNGCVEISNYAPDETDGGNVVIADAIRFGNGMGNVSRGSAGVSGYEQELESSRFWAIKSMGVGMPTTYYDLAGYDDRSDNIGQPARMASQMCRAEGGNRWSRLYVGFHSNAGNGSGRGAWGLYDTRLQTNAPAYYKAQTNLAMRIAKRLHEDLTAAATQGAVPSWGTPGLWIYGSSYGEIYNASVYKKMDTTINEVAFHDNAADCEVLKTPAGRERLARATTRAIIEHLGNYYAESTIPVVFAPDRPEKLKAVNTGTGGVTLSWAMPARQSDSGAVPTGFVVYTSADGRAFGNPITVADAAATSLLITNLNHGDTHYFHVCAVNDGGESPASPVAGAGMTTNGTAEVLVVDGFKRCDFTLAPTRYMANNFTGQVALVRSRMINSFDYVKEHGAALATAGRSFDYADAEHITAALLTNYAKVVWILGAESTADETFSAAEQAVVTTYLQGGGRLFVSGAEIGWDLGRNGGADQHFLTNVLGVAYVSDNGGTGSLAGSTGGIFDGLSLTFNHTNLLADIYAAKYPDVLAPAAAGASVAAVYGATSSGAAIQVSNATYRTVVMGFPFETLLNATQRAAVMTRVMDFFDAGEEEEPDPEPSFDNNPNLDRDAVYFISSAALAAAAENTVALQWDAVGGALGYIIETNTDLLTTNWFPAATNFSTNPAPTTLHFSIPAHTPQLFFRIHAK